MHVSVCIVAQDESRSTFACCTLGVSLGEGELIVTARHSIGEEGHSFRGAIIILWASLASVIGIEPEFAQRTNTLVPGRTSSRHCGETAIKRRAPGQGFVCAKSSHGTLKTLVSFGEVVTLRAAAMIKVVAALVRGFVGPALQELVVRAYGPWRACMADRGSDTRST